MCVYIVHVHACVHICECYYVFVCMCVTMCLCVCVTMCLCVCVLLCAYVDVGPSIKKLGEVSEP